MNATSISNDTHPFLQRTEHIIGRSNELAIVKKYLNQQDARHFLAYFARGGLGKTRLLEEIVEMVQNAGPGFYGCPIIDLFHTETHSSSDVERMIVNGLDKAGRYFEKYRDERVKFEQLRERGAESTTIEKYREALSEHFVSDFNRMAGNARKLVLCFDTIENVQYESSLVEELVNLEKVDPRILPWLLDKLSRLENVLVVFAGRPKTRDVGDEKYQGQLVDSMRTVFGKDLEVRDIGPLNEAETGDFLTALAPDLTKDYASPETLRLVHRVTQGRPIYLHLLVDLVTGFARQPDQVLEILRELGARLEKDPQDEDALEKARQSFEEKFIDELINHSGEDGEYLKYLALMPKGFDAVLIERVIGMPPEEAAQIVARFEKLSFVKRHKPAPGPHSPHGERLFFHDEFYRLLTLPSLSPNLRVRERSVAQGLLHQYEDDITGLENEILNETDTRLRSALRERLQKLQVEYLYYQMVRDPAQGYKEYKRLSSEANRRYSVGFGMRLLDEFLRFYNNDIRRRQFESAGIEHQRVIRESVQMWSERLHWLALYLLSDAFAARVMKKLKQLGLDEEKDNDILGNVIALWVRGRTMLYGYEKDMVDRAQTALDRLPPLAQCSANQKLARARLCNTIGYALRHAGRLEQAGEQLNEAAAAFRSLDGYQDELGMVLGNLANVYARLGRITLGRLLGQESLRVNETNHYDYSAGLSLNNLALVEWLAGNYDQAKTYSLESLERFTELEDAHGSAYAYLNLGEALRKQAKSRIKARRKLDEMLKGLEEARITLEKGLEIARNNDLKSVEPMLVAGIGRAFREMAQINSILNNQEDATKQYRSSEANLREAIASSYTSESDRANYTQDLAELLFTAGHPVDAEKLLSQIESNVGAQYRIVPPDCSPAHDLTVLYFWLLGKVERLRGEMAFNRKAYQDGLRHFVLSYAYFNRFSPGAVERYQMLESLYSHLGALPAPERSVEVEKLRAWTGENNDCIGGVEVKAFTKDLGDLIGA